MKRKVHKRGGLLGRPIGGGFYRISDKEAATLARACGKALPPHGRTYDVTVQHDRGNVAMLMRTPYQPRLHPDAPKRGWVYALGPLSTKPSFL